jgi:hypothetical protein
MKRIIIAAALAITAITSAQAASITGLANTGTGTSGAVDSNYSLAGSSTGPVITYDSQWPISPWLANTDTSKWITPTSTQSQSFDAWNDATYTYTLSFDLTGANASTAWFTGRVAADNAVTVKLNDNVIGGAAGFTDWTSFSAGLNSGFVAGTNTLEFVVTNWALSSGNPTGLRVEFTGSDVAAAVPEPETYAMLLGGLALMGFVARRRKS